MQLTFKFQVVNFLKLCLTGLLFEYIMPANMAINQKRPSSPYQPKNIKNGEKTRVSFAK